MRPDFLSEELYNAKLSMHCIQGFYVDNIKPSSFISRCKRKGVEIPFSYEAMQTKPNEKCRVYLVSDVINTAKKLNLKVTEYKSEKANTRYRETLSKKESELSSEVEFLEYRLSTLKSEINSLEPIAMKSKSMGFSLPSYKRIISNQVSIDDGLACGIYFLLMNDDVVYVGQSINVYARVQNHISDPSKKFNAFSFFQCDRADLDRLEKMYIRFLDPVYNISHSPSKSGFNVGFYEESGW